ncbi:hypothetical protein K3495_g10170 [Podosphaera aphanis]|nr:hypothetical protein K3495_g10170 [Podosphaera aphanis]
MGNIDSEDPCADRWPALRELQKTRIDRIFDIELGLRKGPYNLAPSSRFLQVLRNVPEKLVGRRDQPGIGIRDYAEAGRSAIDEEYTDTRKLADRSSTEFGEAERGATNTEGREEGVENKNVPSDIVDISRETPTLGELHVKNINSSLVLIVEYIRFILNPLQQERTELYPALSEQPQMRLWFFFF